MGSLSVKNASEKIRRFKNLYKNSPKTFGFLFICTMKSCTLEYTECTSRNICNDLEESINFGSYL
jgi:hypothetical protein